MSNSSAGRKLSKQVSRARLFQLKVTLCDVAKPPVWRRLLVRSDIPLDRLHDLIQAAMGWGNYHLHAFSCSAGVFGVPDPELDHRDECRTRLDRLLVRKGDKLDYTYDFGDGWEHEIVLEDIRTAGVGELHPVCLDGSGACPPEDCGGVYGYEHLREVLGDPSNKEHEDMLEWLGLDASSEFDPARFDVNEANAMLAPAHAYR